MNTNWWWAHATIENQYRLPCVLRTYSVENKGKKTLRRNILKRRIICHQTIMISSEFRFKWADSWVAPSNLHTTAKTSPHKYTWDNIKLIVIACVFVPLLLCACVESAKGRKNFSKPYDAMVHDVFQVYGFSHWTNDKHDTYWTHKQAHKYAHLNLKANVSNIINIQFAGRGNNI